MRDWLDRLWLALRGATRERADQYVRTLEEQLDRERSETARERAEVARLREENRALLNSLLGTAGVPPIETPREHSHGISPVRRRSWPQIATTREIEAARQARTKQHTTHGE
jgi:hypothetical protein